MSDKVGDAVHAEGGFIFIQIVGIGRQAIAGSIPNIVGPSAIPKDADSLIPRALDIAEIEEYIESFGVAADNAVLKAGFDGSFRGGSCMPKKLTT